MWDVSKSTEFIWYIMAHRVRLDTASKRKYASVLGAVGGWPWFQRLLRELRGVGDRHGGAPIANVASRWVLEQPAVGALILGAVPAPFRPVCPIHS